MRTLAITSWCLTCGDFTAAREHDGACSVCGRRYVCGGPASSSPTTTRAVAPPPGDRAPVGKATRVIVLECDADDADVLTAWARERGENAWMHFPFVISGRVRVRCDVVTEGER